MKIIFFGDSICTGQYISLHKGWVAQISKRLEGSAIVLNSSVNGRTTRQAIEDMPYHIQKQRPDILIIQFGMNDCNYWESDKGVPRVSPSAFHANLIEIVTRARIFGTKHIFMNTNHSTLVRKKMPYTNITYEESNKYYNELIREATKKSGVILNDIEKKFLTKENLQDFLLPDMLHLNEIGHALYFETIYPKIKETINGNR